MTANPHCDPPAPRRPAFARTAVAALAMLLAAAPAPVALAQAQKPAAQAQKPAPAPDAVVKALYAHYLNTAPEKEVAFDYTNPTIAKDYFDAALMKLLAEDAKRASVRLDFDPFVNAQEFDISEVDYETKPVSAKEALVNASFDNFGQQTLVTYKVVRTPAGWRIMDVLWAGGGTTLRKLLSAPSV